MKNLVVPSLFLCFLFLLPATAQNKTIRKTSPNQASKINPPTRVAKPSEEDASVWNEFASEEHGFWITFPAAQNNVAREKANSFASFDVYTKKAHYGLAVRDLLVSLNNNQLEVLFESIVEETEDEKTRLIGNNDVYLNGVLGKELVYEENDRIVYGRFFIMESKLFMLTVNISKKDYHKDFDRWAHKFLDSFGVKTNVKMDA